MDTLRGRFGFPARFPLKGKAILWQWRAKKWTRKFLGLVLYELSAFFCCHLQVQQLHTMICTAGYTRTLWRIACKKVCDFLSRYSCLLVFCPGVGKFGKERPEIRDRKGNHYEIFWSQLLGHPELKILLGFHPDSAVSHLWIQASLSCSYQVSLYSSLCTLFAQKLFPP